MTIELKPEQERIVQAEIASGRFAGAELNLERQNDHGRPIEL